MIWITGGIAYLIYGLLDFLPDAFLWFSGWLLMVGGVVVFYLGLVKDNHQTGKKMLFWSVWSIVAGGVAVFVPNYPILAMILIIIILMRILIWLLGWWWSLWVI